MSVSDGIAGSGVEELIFGFIARELAGSENAGLGPDDDLLTSGLLDSLGVVRLIGHVEEELAVTVPPTDLVPENFRTVRVMAAYMSGLAVD